MILHILGTWISYRAPIASTQIGNRVIALLPGLAALILLARKPVYPEIGIFEVIVGVAGLTPTFEAVKCGKTIGLANKELLTELAKSRIVERMIKYNKASPYVMNRLRKFNLASPKVLRIPFIRNHIYARTYCTQVRLPV